MTVSELMELLKKRDPSELIVIETSDGYKFAYDHTGEGRFRWDCDPFQAFVIGVDDEEIEGPLGLECPNCHEDCGDIDGIEERTWQQWQCPCCGSWNDRERGA